MVEEKNQEVPLDPEDAKALEELTNQQSSSSPEEEKETAPAEEQPEKFTVLGKEYTRDQMDELVKDYDRLGREFTRRSQILEDPARLQEYMRERGWVMVEPQQETPQYSAEQLEEAKKFLSSLGFVHKEELEAEKRREALEEMLSDLESKYDGRGGLPKFDREAVLDWCVENKVTDPEAAYLKMNWDKIAPLVQKAFSSSEVPFTERKGMKPEVTFSPEKKITFEGGEGSISVDEAIAEILKQSRG